ncbi:XRE family transcriptional regulator [Fulvivirgaceae bacterium BMA10]|uniref:XRE family transcriptional regulator n=1 Tax=Splendidivirga corallicola TaxID=3051826 RepID=A0ABT8KK28_9BACT|nr:XRE family transcriptional regulator [Fulvivirgaceae bacterium BMA10]
MKDDSLSLIGKKIKEERKKRNLSLQQIAERSDVTAGLLSKIENFRTIPSLPVLLNISKALEVNLSELVESVRLEEKSSYTLIRDQQGELEEREDSLGLVYESLIHQDLFNLNIRVNIVRIHGNVFREPIATDGMELVYVLNGDVTYGLNGEKIHLTKGDTLFFDGSTPHSVQNNQEEEAILFKVYLIPRKD